MKTNSDTTQALYIGLDVHKEKTVIAILNAHREAEPRDYGSVATSQHALERVIRRIAKAQGRKLSELYVCYEASGFDCWLRVECSWRTERAAGQVLGAPTC